MTSIMSKTQLSLNNIPYEIYLEYIIYFIDIKDIGSLCIVSKQLKEYFDNNEIWKQLYFRTNPPTILDTSIHIGDHREHRNSDTDTLIKKYGSCLPCYWSNYGNIDDTFSQDTDCCKGIIHIIPSLSGRNNHISHREFIKDLNIDYTKLYINDQSPRIKHKYYDYIKELHIQTNKHDNYSTINLCRNPRHYIVSTLGFTKNNAVYKSYKKITLEKMNTKSKKENKTKKYHLKNKEQKLNKLKLKYQKLEQEVINLNIESTKLTRFTQKSKITIDLINKQLKNTNKKLKK